ncbi:MAG: protein jag [Clostridia bacterium]|nr:protein jag [Clostridia bacterium]
MKSVEVTGRTVEEAIGKALNLLEIDRDRADIEILAESSKGFLGLIGQRDALVKVTKIVTVKDIALNLLEQVFPYFGVKPAVKLEEREAQIVLQLTGDNMGVLIGRRGDTLDALQYWLNLSLNRKLDQKVKVIVDIEGYREKRREILTKLAKKLSVKVKQTRRKVILEPMNPFERSIIHTALQNDNEVQTFSEGEEPFRKVVIALKK